MKTKKDEVTEKDLLDSEDNDPESDFDEGFEEFMKDDFESDFENFDD